MADAMFWARLAEKAERVLCRPGVTYPWAEVVLGAEVAGPGGTNRTMAAVAPNTWRGHRRKDKSLPGSGVVFQRYFVEGQQAIASALSGVQTREHLHRCLNRMSDEIRARMTNVVDGVRASYNSVRKPVDLYVEHLVAMAAEIPDQVRRRLVPLLFLPLDKVILGPVGVGGGDTVMLFSPSFLRRLGLSQRSSYGHIRTERVYLALQANVEQKARQVAEVCGRPFPPIYFDLLWNGRYGREGSNLFELNP